MCTMFSFTVFMRNVQFYRTCSITKIKLSIYMIVELLLDFWALMENACQHIVTFLSNFYLQNT